MLRPLHPLGDPAALGSWHDPSPTISLVGSKPADGPSVFKRFILFEMQNDRGKDLSSMSWLPWLWAGHLSSGCPVAELLSVLSRCSQPASFLLYPLWVREVDETPGSQRYG